MQSLFPANQQNKQWILRRFFLFVFGVFLNFSAYSSVLNLQSSINIEDGLGTTASAVSFITAALFSLLFTPLVLRIFGVKRCMIASECTYVIYLIANLYPEFYTLIPAATFNGMGNATIWTCMSVINVYFAKLYAALPEHADKSEDFYITLLSGYFFTIFQCCQIFGNLISYVALYAFNEPLPIEESGGNTTYPSMTSFGSRIDEYYYCGSRDCQDPSIVTNSLDQYNPTSQLTLLILIGVFITMCFTALLLHGFLLPDIVQTSPGTTAKLETDIHANEVCDSELMNGESSTNHMQIVKEDDKMVEGGFEEDSNREKKGSLISLMVKSVKDIFLHLIQPKQLLIIPITVYDGLMAGFVFSELTRAYSSCVLGVSTVGINMAIYGFADAIFSYISGKFGQKLGRPVFFVICSVIDVCNYLYCLLWKPSLEYSWTVYVIFFSFGVTDGMWQTLINVMYIDFFPEDHNVSLASWNLLLLVGVTLQYSWSTSMCIYTKLYIQFGILAFGMSVYGVAEFLHSKQMQRKKNNQSRMSRDEQFRINTQADSNPKVLESK